MPDADPLRDAKQRLDRLIANARDQLLMPITIAEVLYRIRNGDVALDAGEVIRKQAYHWCAAICRRLFKKELSLNRSYWDKLFASHMPAGALAAISKANIDGKGVAEAYVFARLRQTANSLREVRSLLAKGATATFSLVEFLDTFERDEKLRRSVDKAYEILVHALFNAIASRLRAQVTVSVSAAEADVLSDFEQFCRLLLGVDRATPSMTVPARLYRVGGANSRDGGVDMWANFGPAIQVKHVSLKLDQVQPIVEGVSAEQLVIVCKDADREPIEALATALGMAGRIRGIVMKTELIAWYQLALGPKHAHAMASPLFRDLLAEFDDEFPLADPATIDSFGHERAYDKLTLSGIWSIVEPASRR